MNNCERCLKLDPLSRVANTIEPVLNHAWLTASVWQTYWQQMVNAFRRSNEPRVWQRVDRLGNVYWQAYDPVTGRSTASASEAELRAWIEQLYYRK